MDDTIPKPKRTTYVHVCMHISTCSRALGHHHETYKRKPVCTYSDSSHHTTEGCCSRTRSSSLMIAHSTRHKMYSLPLETWTVHGTIIYLTCVKNQYGYQSFICAVNTISSSRGYLRLITHLSPPRLLHVYPSLYPIYTYPYFILPSTHSLYPLHTLYILYTNSLYTIHTLSMPPSIPYTHPLYTLHLLYTLYTPSTYPSLYPIYTLSIPYTHPYIHTLSIPYTHPLHTPPLYPIHTLSIPYTSSIPSPYPSLYPIYTLSIPYTHPLHTPIHTLSIPLSILYTHLLFTPLSLYPIHTLSTPLSIPKTISLLQTTPPPQIYIPSLMTKVEFSSLPSFLTMWKVPFF